MRSTTAVLFAALLAPVALVTAYLLAVNLGHWPHGGVLNDTVLFAAVLAGVAPILLARFSLALRILIAAIYVYPCVVAVGLYSLAFECSMFQRCLS